MRRLPEILARFVAHRPWWLIIAAVVLTAAAVPGITMLRTETGYNTFVSPRSEVFQDNARYEEEFGGDPITLLLTAERLEDIFSDDNLVILSEFEQRISQDARYRSVFSPVAMVLYNPNASISPEMSPLIPDEQHALITVTPIGNMDGGEMLQAVQDVEQFFDTRPLQDDVSITVIANAKVMKAISRSIGNNMALLLAIAVLVMTLILFLLFRVRWRLLSLLMVGIGALWTFGVMGYVSVPLSLATMAVLPILIGLGIDYSIQFHSRYQEELTTSSSVAEAIITSLKRMFPAVGIALLATIIGFITLYISEVPMVRDFGVILAVGVLLCSLVALFLLHSVVCLGDRKMPVAKLGQAAVTASRRTEKVLSWIAATAIRYPLPILLVAVIPAIAGGVVDRWLPVNTDYEKLMPQDIAELGEVHELRRVLGYGGELRFMMEADNVTDPEVLGWLKEYEDRELGRYAELISVNSPAVLVSQAAGGTIPERQEEIDQILNDPRLSLSVQQVVSADKRMASVSFRSEYVSLQEVHDRFEQMRQDAQPPEGVRIAPVGTLALGSSIVDAVVGTRLLMNILCIGAVFLVLLLVYRRFSRAIFIILPVFLVIGWASLDMYAAGIALNPLTAILGVIIIGINTEFMVLLTSRYEEEKQKGESPRRAMVIASSKMGRAIVTTGLTTLAGFGVLATSNFVMIRDFGIVTILGVFLCLVSTIAVVPPLIVWSDERSARKRQKVQSADGKP